MAMAVDLILAKPGMRRVESRSIFICQVLVYHWSTPLHKTLAPLMEGYNVGLETGDIESAGYNCRLTTFRNDETSSS